MREYLKERLELLNNLLTKWEKIELTTRNENEYKKAKKKVSYYKGALDELETLIFNLDIKLS